MSSSRSLTLATAAIFALVHSVLVFSVGGTLMYAALGALAGRGIHGVIRALRAA